MFVTLSLLIINFCSTHCMEQYNTNVPTIIISEVNPIEQQYDQSSSPLCSPCSSDRSDHSSSSVNYTELKYVTEQLKFSIEQSIKESRELTLEEISPYFDYLAKLIQDKSSDYRSHLQIIFNALLGQQKEREQIEKINRTISKLSQDVSTLTSYVEGISDQFSTSGTYDGTGFNLSDNISFLKKVIKSTAKDLNSIIDILIENNRAKSQKNLQGLKNNVIYFKRKAKKILHQETDEQKKTVGPICYEISTLINKRHTKMLSDQNKIPVLSLTSYEPTFIERLIGVRKKILYEEYAHDPRTNDNCLSNNIQPLFCKKFFIRQDNKLHMLSQQWVTNVLHVGVLLFAVGTGTITLLKTIEA